MNHDKVMFDLLVRAYVLGKFLEFKNKTSQTSEGNKTNLNSGENRDKACYL